MSAWFDVKSMDVLGDDQLPADDDAPRLQVGVDRVHAIIAGELAVGIEPKRIIVAGFSQGVISLTSCSPLTSSADDGNRVRGGALGGVVFERGARRDPVPLRLAPSRRQVGSREWDKDARGALRPVLSFSSACGRLSSATRDHTTCRCRPTTRRKRAYFGDTEMKIRLCLSAGESRASRYSRTSGLGASISTSTRVRGSLDLSAWSLTDTLHCGRPSSLDHGEGGG